MSPQAQQTITEVINEVNKKSLYKERLSGIDEGIEIGKKEGKLEGKKEGIEEVARNLKGIMSDEESSKRTGLTVNRIKEL